MKKSIKIWLILGIVAVCFLTAALILTLNGRFFAGYYLAYEVNDDQTTCTVTKCIPLGATEITVPKTVGRYRVSAVGSYAFANRTKLTGVCLPEGLESIGMGAFYECERMQHINIPDSITAVGSYAFFNCESLTSITLSANANNIGARIFEGCTSITEASVPASAIAALPPENITSVEINGGTSIGNYAFKNFSKLTSITISPSVETVGIGAFMGCTNVTSATVPAHLISSVPQNRLMYVVINGGTHIPKKALYFCNNLTSITLHESIESIGDLAFEGCYKLVEVFNFSSLEITAGALENGGIARYALHVSTSREEAPKTRTDENGYVFYEDGEVCYLLGYLGKETALTLPETCNGKSYAIRAYAFYMCADLTSVTISDAVVGIEQNAFAHCKRIENITFPDSLIAICEYAFYECDELAQISLGKNITRIGAYAFDECYKLENVLFRGTVEEWNAVEQGYCWIFYTPATEVICTDGAVNLK